MAKKKLVQSEWADVKSLTVDPSNPRVIKDKDFKDLVKKIEKDPDFLLLREIIVDENGIIKAGNQRYQAAISAGMKKVPIKRAEQFSEQELKKFMIIDNTHSGEFDQSKLNDLFDQDELKELGIEISLPEPLGGEAEIEFSEYLDEAHNYVVLTFKNEVDWLSAQTHFGIKSVHSKRANGKPWSKGIGRVINGAEYLKSIKDV